MPNKKDTSNKGTNKTASKTRQDTHQDASIKTSKGRKFSLASYANYHIDANKDCVYQIKITLRGSSPPIWRRILVSPNTTLFDLHYVIQTVMGWENYHPFVFRPPKKRGKDGFSRLKGFKLAPFFVDIYEAEMEEIQNTLNMFLKEQGDFIWYQYDFGDFWEHKLFLEKILPRSLEMQIPSCIKGKGACPPEDIGGINAYYRAINAFERIRLSGGKETPRGILQSGPHRQLQQMDPNRFDDEDLKKINSIISK